MKGKIQVKDLSAITETSLSDNGNLPSLWAIVPVKPLHQSKMRLAHLLPVEERVQLMYSFLRRTLTILAGATSIERTLVVSGDDTVLELAGQQGAATLDEGEADGLNNAVDRAVQEAAANRATAALILPADLPLIRLEDVEMMAQIVRGPAARRQHQAVPFGICSDIKRDGTNALLISLPTPFTFHYGPMSFSKHLEEAARLGMSAQIMHSPGLEFDLDTEEDWEKYRRGISHAINI